ncbi:hypothetical protein CDL12_16531 [Handroanthus impetiginosus]|uniref:Uncharacterized protein n=1 Tax=Handroanthus impetiginosus TaxID=429701 RepID=A0A2G9H043_9LAMI|nr:hypothetical protein CDL12_16531 [Handroanthus impetiginosus]
MEQKLAPILQKCKTIKQLKQTHVQTLINGLKNSNFLAAKLMSLSSDFISLDYADKVFQDLKNPNLISYNTLIKCYIGKSHNNATILFNRMRESGISSNSFTFTFLLRCFESFHKLEAGEMVHGHVLKLGLQSSMFLMNTLLDFYAKCGGNLDVVRKMFDEMPERDVVSWNTMIRTYMSYGEIDSAIRLFESMPERNLVTWNSIVSGLVKTGNIELANKVFQQMPERNSVSWNAMISGYIKSGDLKNAKAIFDEMPERSMVSWTTMVSGYAMIVHGHENLLKLLIRKILDKEPNDPSYLKLITNLSSSAGEWEDVLNFRVATRKKGVEKVPGCSSIQVGESVHEFVAKDTSHPQRKEVYKALRSLKRHLVTISDMHMNFLMY